jgi:hypothetical protein
MRRKCFLKTKISILAYSVAHTHCHRQHLTAPWNHSAAMSPHMVNDQSQYDRAYPLAPGTSVIAHSTMRDKPLGWDVDSCRPAITG